VEKLSVKDALLMVNSLYDDVDYRIRVLRKKQEDIPPNVFAEEMEELTQARSRITNLREVFISRVLSVAAPIPSETTNKWLVQRMTSLEDKLVNLWNFLTADKKDEAAEDARKDGEFEETLTIPEESPYVLDLRCRQLDYAIIKFEDESFSVGNKGLMYTIDYLNGSVTFDERLAGQTVEVRYKLA